MSSYDSSQQQSVDNQNNSFEKRPFQYDYFLSKSKDVFASWNNSAIVYQIADKSEKNQVYLREEFAHIRLVEKFKTAYVIRANAFIHVLSAAFKEVLAKFRAIIQRDEGGTKKQHWDAKLTDIKKLEGQLTELLSYLQVVLDQGLETFYNSDDNFQQSVFEIVASLYTFAVDPKLLWDILGAQAHLIDSAAGHSVALGGNHSYYQNILRSLLKHNLKLKQIYDKLSQQLKSQKIQNWKDSVFLIKAITQVWILSKDSNVEQKEKRDFIDCLKGMYFLHIQLRSTSTYFQYIFTSCYIQHLEAHRMFKNYIEMENTFIKVIGQARYNQDLMALVEALQLNLLPFEKRKRVPEIQSLALDIVTNYIGSAKFILGEEKLFPEIAALSESKVYASSQYLLRHQSVNGLVDLLMRIQQSSKEAFSLGSLDVHKVYLRMSQLLRRIYLSYEHQNWLFPTDILLYIPLHHFIEISDDIKGDIKKTLFTMVNALSQDHLPFKIMQEDGLFVRRQVSRGEHLQVILHFLQACKRQQQYINLPQILPKNSETSILYIKALQVKLNQKQPTEDQKGYIIENLRYCESQKLTINFTWFENKQLPIDRQIEFNIEKDLAEQWMKRIYRETINQRQSLKIDTYFQKYRNNKLKLFEMAEMLKYNHGLNPCDNIPKNSIRVEDIINLLDQMQIPLLINFDIFDLNPDQEISLNYLHVCLGLYNSTVEQAPENPSYALIMEKIMAPYLKFPNSSLTKFKIKYPGFFKKWIYSPRINQLFSQLGVYIEQRGTDESCRQDIVNKIKMIGQMLDNKENIEKNMGLEQLIFTIVSFSTIVTPEIHPKVYIEAVELYCLFLNTFPTVKTETSLDFVLSVQTLSNKRIIEQALEHVKSVDYTWNQNQINILSHMIRNLPSYINIIGIRKTFEVILTYLEISKENHLDIQAMQKEIMESQPEKLSFLGNLLQFLIILKNLSNCLGVEGQEQLIAIKQISMVEKLQKIHNLISQQLKNKQFDMEGLHVTEIIFLDEIVKLLENKKLNNIEFTTISKTILKQIILSLGSNEDYMYFAEKLDMQQLIFMGGDRQQSLLIDMIVENKHKETQTELIKKLLRQNHLLSEVAEKAIDILNKQKEKIHSYHINRFIQINSRYPREKVEQFLIEHLGCERNNSAAKINQKYLINDLSKRLQKIPKKLCEELLLKPILAEERDRLIELVSQIFEKLLYLPIKKFDRMDMKVVEQHPEDQDWNTQSDQEQTKPIESKSKSKDKQKEKYSEKQNSASSNEQIQLMNYHNSDNDSDESYPNYDDCDRSQFLDIFTDHDKRQQLVKYDKLMTVREELDIELDGDYSKLKEGSSALSEEGITDKLLRIVLLMNEMDPGFSLEIATKMPAELFDILKKYDLNVEISPQTKQKIIKRRQPCRKRPVWLQQFFSDRSESDQSVEQEDEDIDDEGDYSENQNQQQEDDYDGQNADNSEDDYHEDMIELEQMAHHRVKVKPQKNYLNKRKFKEDEIEGPPLLLPTYSKIEEEISGAQLKKDEIVKLLEIALFMLLQLPESQVHTRHITSFYLEILESNFGQMFLESVFTVIRFDETNKNLEFLLKVLEQQQHRKVEVGLQQVSTEDVIKNVLYLIRENNQKQQSNSKGNMLFIESGSLLPIAVEMLAKFDLPIQNNCITLLLIYITTNKLKIRNKIQELNYSIDKELPNNQKRYKLKKTEIARIIEKICQHRSNNRIWSQLIQQKMGLQIKQELKLMECIKGYGKSLLKKATDTGIKIFLTIHQSEQSKSLQQKEHLHKLENSHHIISKLVLSCKQQIKQFYFINKQIIRQFFNQGSEDNKNVPKTMLKLKKQLLNNKELMNLCQSMFYFLKLLKDQFYGKIEDKMFGKLIHYPKMVIETAWYYIFMFAKVQQYVWTSPSQVEIFFEKHSTMMSYQFRDLQEVFNLILHFLNLQSFCNDKFKELFMPVLMKNSALAQQISLRFKIPKIDQQVENQDILVTRKCSFDMAFYQVTGNGLTVQFHQEEGSDHGGLVRELMIGWKGKGVGQEAFFIGKILGISFKQGVPYGGNLDLSMFVAITNYTPSINFFEEVDPQIHRNLVYIQNNDPQCLSLTFTVVKEINGKKIEFELVEGGRHIDLVQSNKQKYLQVYSQKYFYLGRQKELQELREGFNTVVFSEYAQIFTPLQMLKQIRGQEIVDVKMLISKAKYEGYSEESPIIQWFWSIVQQFDQQRMNTFIQFVTGSPKITVYNSNFSITIEKVYDINCLPVAHTCFNTLDLPEYGTKEILQKKLVTAISEGINSFGLM